jgi:hypothetical protein
MRRALFSLFVVLIATGCLGKPKTLPPCDAWSVGNVICGLMNPEDLGHMPEGGWVVVSEMHMADQNEGEDAGPFIPGRLTALRAAEDGGKIERMKIFPNEWAESAPNSDRWGDPSCEGPPGNDDFQPRGIDIGPGPEGRPALAVVTHGKREVIDLFEIAPGLEPALEWRGCVEMIETMSANDVALLADGSFVVTNMIPRFESVGFKAIWNLSKISMGFRTGSVLHWSAEGGWVELENSQASAPNGIATSADGRVVYVAEWGGEAVVRLRFAEGLSKGAIPERDEVEIEGSPDNLTWTEDGRLLVAAQMTGPMGALRCGMIDVGGCDIGFSVTSIEPEEFVATPIAAGRGAASVALEVGDEIWVGVFAGDAITRLPKAE